MTCYHPLVGYRSRAGRNPNGRWPLVFNTSEGYIDLPVTMKCGKCIGCRLAHSKEWAVRCVHEASLHTNNCFVTLTYRDEALPEYGSLNKRHFVLFMKSLRKKFGAGIRFFHCGEYGEKLRRPHHHACIFNHQFEDKKLWTVRRGVKLYRSPSLEKIWKHGYSSIGDVNFQTAAYCARYIMKKINGPLALEHYNTFDKTTGEIFKELVPEYITMSRCPGIAKEWFKKWSSDVYPSDMVKLFNQVPCKPPRYYDNLYDIENPVQMKIIKQRRLKKFNSENNTSQRLKARKTVLQLKTKSLKRSYEQEKNSNE
ncbi:MAG: replication initiator protein [Microviridae sp.]|nr:MAG: replication initiator protein [Microviridae sp.]